MISRTLGQVKPELARVAGISGMALTDSRLVDRINLAQETLITQGRWPGMLARLKFCAVGGSIVLPSGYDSIIKASIDRSAVRVESQWYEFLSYGPQQQDFLGWVDSFIDNGESPVVRQPCGKIVRVYSQGDERIEGERPSVIIRGIGEDGLPITSVVAGETIDGVQVELRGDDNVQDWNDTAEQFWRITSVVKPRTKFPVEIYYVDALSAEYLGARYAAKDVNPSFRAYRVPSLGTAGEATVHVLARRRFVPVEDNNDPMMITCLPALRSMMIAIQKEEAGELDASMVYQARAIEALKAESRAYFGATTVSVDFVGDSIAYGSIPHIV